MALTAILIAIITALFAVAYRAAKQVVRASVLDNGIKLREGLRHRIFYYSQLTSITAASVDQIGFESWGLTLQTGRIEAFIDEDTDGFDVALNALSQHFDFDPEWVRQIAHDHLSHAPFSGFNLLLWPKAGKR